MTLAWRAARRIGQQHIETPGARGLHRIVDNRCAVRTLTLRDDSGAVALAPGLKLLHRRRAERIARRQHHRQAVRLQAAGHLADGGRLAGAVDAHEQQDTGTGRPDLKRLLQGGEPLLEEVSEGPVKRSRVVQFPALHPGRQGFDDALGGIHTNVRQQQRRFQLVENAPVDLPLAEQEVADALGKAAAGLAQALLETLPEEPLVFTGGFAQNGSRMLVWRLESVTSKTIVRMSRNEVRIIGGLWKGRKLQVPAGAAVRPSLGRVRETLFNWLAGEVEGSDCLDLFAGSGALGFEALSRGAHSIVLVENNRSTAQALKKNAQRLGASNCIVRRQSAIPFLKRSAAEETGGTANQWDIVFLDPPFASGLLPAALDALRNCNSLRPGGRIYVELERRAEIEPPGFSILKQGTAGDTRFGLLASP